MRRAILLFALSIALSATSLSGIGGCGGGTGSGGSGGSGGSTSGGKSFSESGSAITINDIVNGSSSGALAASSDEAAISTSSSAALYFGRFYFFDGVNLFSGSVKFKLKKQNDSEAYFSDFTLEHYSAVTGLASHTDIVTASTDLDVPAAFDASTNHVKIEDATKRFVGFELDFGNNTYFGDITNAGVIFSSDFTTMAGGNNNSFFFIAQKVDSQPDVALTAIQGDWNVITFQVSSTTGNIAILGTSTVDVSGTGGTGFTAFSGTNSSGGTFDGELTLTDATSAAFFFGYGSGSGTPTASEIDGGFLISADQTLAVGFDLLNGSYFGAER